MTDHQLLNDQDAQDRQKARRAFIIALPIATFGLGYYMAPKDQLDVQIEQTGFLRVETTEVLSTTVESLRAENSLVVWSYKGNARVRAKREDWLFLEGTQTLIVPAVVTYRLSGSPAPTPLPAARSHCGLSINFKEPNYA